jgi:hypothetical protein
VEWSGTSGAFLWWKRPRGASAEGRFGAESWPRSNWKQTARAGKQGRATAFLQVGFGYLQVNPVKTKDEQLAVKVPGQVPQAGRAPVVIIF